MVFKVTGQSGHGCWFSMASSTTFSVDGAAETNAEHTPPAHLYLLLGHLFL